MQSNTASIENQPINFPSFSVEKKTCTSDPFTIADGRYIGSDGFVVPKDFGEFFERFPDYVRKWVGKHADKSAPKQNLEDWTQDLLIHLLNLPLTSKHREAGMNDIVQTFDPLKHYGANEARFRNYINLCLVNKFRTLHSNRTRDALYRTGNVSLDEQTEVEDPRSVGDEFCHLHSAHLREAANVSEKQAWDERFLREFVSFMRRQDPKGLPALGAVLATGTQGEAANWLGITELEFDRMHARVRHLARSFREWRTCTETTEDGAGNSQAPNLVA